MLTPNGTGSKEGISNFEKEINFNLPADYKKFLLDTNGAALNDGLISPVRPGRLLVDSLFGLSHTNETDLRFWLNELGEELPEKSIIIGSDAGGGFFLLCTEEDYAGIYYYDHSYQFPTSDDDENTYFIYPSFSGFISDLIK